MPFDPFRYHSGVRVLHVKAIKVISTAFRHKRDLVHTRNRQDLLCNVVLLRVYVGLFNEVRGEHPAAGSVSTYSQPPHSRWCSGG